MAALHPLFVANGTAGVTNPREARLALASLLSGPGVLNGFSVSGSSSGPNMKYNVSAGAVATQRGTLATDGLYLWANDGVYTVDTGAPAPTSGTRYDVIYALARNANDGFGDANSDPVIGFVVGTAGSTPTVPAAPAGALVLAQALVATNAANAAAGTTITNVAAKAYLKGQGDTGLVTVAYGAGVQVHANPLQYQVKNGVCYVYGDAQLTSGSFAASTQYNITAAGAFPAPIAGIPGTEKVINCGNGNTARCIISGSGQMIIVTGPTSNAFVNLAGAGPYVIA